MPTYRSINIALHSQFDIQSIPEYCPAQRQDYISRGITGFIPKFIDNTSSTCSVYVPSLPGSTFWIRYSISPPVPDNELFLFKLYINGAHIVSWATSNQDDWKGKMMFGLYERPEDEQGRKRVEKRTLCFESEKKGNSLGEDMVDVFDENSRIEIKVHRANGRKRIERVMEEYSKSPYAQNIQGINLVNAGRAGADHPKRFYKYALIDPIDQPFATFRYYYRTWNQLRDLGLLGDKWNSLGEVNDLPVIEPYEPGLAIEKKKGSDDGLNEGEKALFRQHGHDNGSSPRPSVASDPPRAYIPRGAPTTLSDKRIHKLDQRPRSCTQTPPEFYRLSMSPAGTPVPVAKLPRRVPITPPKSDSNATANRPHPVKPADDQTLHTPSPATSPRENPSTSSSKRRWGHGRSVSSMMKVMSNAWKRQT